MPSTHKPAAGSGHKGNLANPIILSDDESTSGRKFSQKMGGLRLGSDVDMKSERDITSESETENIAKSSAKSQNDAASRKRKNVATIITSDEEEEEDLAPPRKKLAVTEGKPNKTKSSVPPKKTTETAKRPTVLDISSDESSSEKASSSKKPLPKKVTPAASKKESKPKVEEKKGEAKSSKPHFAAMMAKRSAGPSAPGSKEIPVGQPNCLAGLTFVFTGELTSLSREEASDLAKRYGGRVTGAPSSKTSYVVVGDGAGPSKLATIKKNGLKTLDEDGFLDLIATREAVLDDKTKEKLRKEEEKIKKDAQEMETRERKEAKVATQRDRPAADPTSQLWTTKYAPASLSQICGNKTSVEKIQTWLHDWPESRRVGFRNGGKFALNTYKALLLYGPPGVGKTTSAHLCAKLEGYTTIELNASDARSKKLVESATNINNASLDTWMTGKDATSGVGGTFTDKTVLIMDEVDGMSAGDRGGVVALKALIKKTKIPIICIANDVQSQKLKPLVGTAANIQFQKPPAAQIKSRIASICYKEKMNIPANVLEQLITGAQSDIRQILNMLSTWKLSKGDMTFDESKQLVEANQKYSILTPFNCTSKVLGPYLFSRTSRETLGEKMELYFHEPSLMPLFIQENYLKQAPSRASGLQGPDLEIKTLELMQKASESISDADMVDSLLRGAEQHWSLMPLHACLSLVRPASFMYGQSSSTGTYSYKDSASFPQWLGQNSKQNKLQRTLGDIQAKMRMKVSGDKTEIRRHYIPALAPRMIDPLGQSKDNIQEVIDVMDAYYLSREDWDTIVELGVGDRNETSVLKGIPTATKTAFTKSYNSADHPIAFHKGTDLGAPIKKIAAKDVPDLEEAFDIDDEVPEDEEDVKPKVKDTGINDKLVKEGKPKATKDTKGKATSKETAKKVK